VVGQICESAQSVQPYCQMVGAVMGGWPAGLAGPGGPAAWICRAAGTSAAAEVYAAVKAGRKRWVWTEVQGGMQQWLNA